MAHFVFYLSSHGHGHGVRESFLINGLPAGNQVTIVTALEKSFFDEEIKRPFCYRFKKYDEGAIQVDAIVIDEAQTIKAMSAQEEYNSSDLDDEVNWLHSVGADHLVADSVLWVGALGEAAQIPTTLITNFTWLDIINGFSIHASNVSGEVVLNGEINQAQLAELKLLFSSYIKKFTSIIPLAPAMASLLEVVEPHTKERHLFRRGKPRANDLRKKLGIAPKTKIALLYVGKYGMDQCKWAKLEKMTGWHFISLFPIPISLSNYTVIDKKGWQLQEYGASCDALIMKLGYNSVLESLSMVKPTLFIPRPSFAESAVIQAYFEKVNPATQEISEALFRDMEWGSLLDKVSIQKAQGLDQTIDGTQEVVRELLLGCEPKTGAV